MSVLPADGHRNPSAIKRTPTKQRVGAVWLGGDGVVVVVRRHAWRPSPERRGYGGRSFARASDSPPTRSTVSCTRAGGSRQLVLRGVPCADRAGRFASLCGLTAALCPHSMPLSD